jgi:hypothetical protein
MTRTPTPSRRQLLQAGAFSLATPGLVAASVGGKQTPAGGPADKSVIFLLLCGGPSHLDTWDLKPDAPDGIRGPYKPAATTVPGVRISELAPRLAGMAQDFALIRSMTHVGNISNHFDAMHHLLSGQSDAPPDSPYFGAILSKVRPSQRNVASHVWLIKCVGDPVFCAANIGNGGHLGAAHSPLFVGAADNHPALPNFRAPDLFSLTDPERAAGRRQLLGALTPATTTGQRATQDWQDIHQRAFELLTGATGRHAFDLAREPATLRARYGQHPLGQNLLLARRLVEAGVRLVSVVAWCGLAPKDKFLSVETWDMHGNAGIDIFGNGWNGLGYALPVCDQGVAALLDDLHERGLLDDTLVVLVGEFGRTPRISKGGSAIGRDHWPNVYSAMLAGAGVRGGSVYGASDKQAAYVKDRPVSLENFSATLLHALGIAPETPISQDGFSVRANTGQVIEELF